MSGYNEKTGIFELTQSKHDIWLRRDMVPDGFVSEHAYGSMFFSADLLRFIGYEVTRVETNFLRVKATPEQLWEALSGTPSNPDRAKQYYKKPKGVL